VSRVLAAAPTLGRMTAFAIEPGENLIREIRRYLAFVDLLRREGLEPSWRPERASSPPETSRETSDRAA
jgi:hypothetical protein